MHESYIVNISGKVQGVYFRASSQQVAIDYCLSGYAKNLANGDVELVISGEKHNIDKMLIWLKKGPPEADVKNIQYKKIVLQPYNFFSIN